MTYHRWKKMVNLPAGGDAERHSIGLPDDLIQHRPGAMDADNELKRLEIENMRLRRLVTDMLLEKLRLEDELRPQQRAPLGRPGRRK